ncbi:DNA recombination protein RmuC [Flavobacteriaceae bacterium]|jgi:DNA recombination protein RmuC|nr:DNA recombination protein RmuC [Flavobacteriaceae bacterium]MBT4231278.1 DNA recombination protein RmuC [Flavobacteriaceae bacterium]MBT5392778.1 DNA recombination protein RmuC [Flavobacteriaceae bacterium]MBT7984660.1 DNA recombination protein RmuC [Flavobacteriaceae bacterium]MDA7731540.1 DNA recombination protein RmuC [Flavobacteriaceae bacterium]
MEIVLNLLILTVLVIITYNLFSKNKKSNASIDSDLSNEITNLRVQLGVKDEKIRSLKESKELESENLKKEFKILANSILEENSEKFKKQNKDQIGSILEPLGEEIKKFKKKIEDNNIDFVERNTVLDQKIQSLNKLNEQLSKDANNLASALKGDSKTQGDWGEAQLEVLLEKSGLMKDIHYSTQGGYKDQEGNIKKPDFIVSLPDNKHLIIDSKVSLTAYELFYNSENDDQKENLKNHITSIRKHFKDLSSKNYTELYGINTPDQVFMYIPIEPALFLALQEDKNIFMDAYDKRVVLVSNTTLLSTLRVVSELWQFDDQKRNVLEIAKQSGLLYDKFEGFVSDLIKVGNNINSSQSSYQDAMNKLSEGKGNLVSKVENLKKLGAKTKKNLPQKLLDRSTN